MTCQACVIGACGGHPRPPVCVCDTPRFDGRCHCTRDHVVGECRNCHRPHKPAFSALRDDWRTRLGLDPVVAA